MVTTEMTTDKAVRYACRALAEERATVAADRERTLTDYQLTTFPPHREYATKELVRHDEHLANIDAAMRALNDIAQRGEA